MIRAWVNRIWRALRSLPPSLAVALIASAMLFAPSNGTTQPPTDTSTKGGRSSGENNQNEEWNATDGQTGPQAAQPIPAQSLLAQLFGRDAVDPFFTLPDTANGQWPIANGSEDATAGPSNAIPDNEPARSIYWYLVNSSNIGFEANTSRLNLALATADTGNPEALDALIRDYETKFDAFQRLQPPEDLRQIHEDSSRVLLRYVQHLKNVRIAEKGKIREVWAGPELAAVGAEAARLTQQIRDIVRNFDIALPKGVLP